MVKSFANTFGLVLTTALVTLLQPCAVVAKPKESFTVMSRNLYFGADFAPAFLAILTQDPNFPSIAAAAAQQGLTSGFEVRMKAVAQEIADSGAVLVGLQETAIWTYNGVVVADMLALIKQYLSEDHGLEYEEVSPTRNAFGIAVEGEGGVGVSMSFGDVILAKASTPNELKVDNPQESSFAVNFATSGIVSNRGWVAVDAKIPGCHESFRFVTTHLEAVEGPFRAAQAMELIQDPDSPFLTTDSPVVLVADLNSQVGASGDATDIILGSGFIDAWADAGDGGDGFTFGHDPNLADPSVEFDTRIDYVLARGLVAVHAEVTDPEISGDPRPLWPSDHGGVIATFACDVQDEDEDSQDEDEDGQVENPDGNGEKSWCVERN